MRRILIIAALAVACPAIADEAPTLHGDDGYAAAPVLSLRTGASGDLFAAGARVLLAAPTGGDVHAAGFTVTVEGETGGDLYAAGADVDLRAAVGGDANLAGGAVDIAEAVRIGGNARLSGGTVHLRGAVSGAAAIAAGEVTVDGSIVGDLRITAAALTFGPGATIGGDLTYTSPEPLEIPVTVIDPARVRYVATEGDVWDAESPDWQGMSPSPDGWTVTGGILLTLAFALLVGATLLALMPRQIATLRRTAHGRPGMTMLLGLLGLSALVGLIPVSAISLVGLPLLPIAVLLLILVWLLGYLLGAYVLAMAVARGGGLDDAPSIQARIGVLAAAIVGAALLNFIPVVGWIANIAVLLLGVGAFTALALAALAPRLGAAPDTRTPET